LLIVVSSPTFADEAEAECAGIAKISATLGYEVRSLNDSLMEVITEDGSIYLKEMSSACICAAKRHPAVLRKSDTATSGLC